MTTKKENIFLFIPNIIGYFRIILAFVAFYFMPINKFITLSVFSASLLLDAFDGYCARIFQQSTQFGAVLDMITDRCSTTCLLVRLAAMFPQYTFLFQILIFLDISSHWIHMYISLLSGRRSHKESKNILLRLYYYKPILFLICFSNEAFFCVCYMLYWGSGPVIFKDYSLWPTLLVFATPLTVLKQFLNFVKLYEASKEISILDMNNRKKN